MSSAGKYRQLIDFVRELYGSEGHIALHAPVFAGNEKLYLNECIDSTYVSSVGKFVDQFEAMMREVTGARFAIAAVNGTAALHMCLILAGVKADEEVITQPLTFVATCNAISYLHAHPVFIDVDRDTLSLSPAALKHFLTTECELREGRCINRGTGRRIAAVVPMHTFGLPGRAAELAEICAAWNITLIEDTAESLGSYVGTRHTGLSGQVAAFSFNGNKTVTSGGGGCIVTNDERLGPLAKHLTTTAKLPHSWEFFHDQVGYNYRMPNLNAALACAQLEQLPFFITNKRRTADAYAAFCREHDIAFVSERDGVTSNYWLNAILVDEPAHRDALLRDSNEAGVSMRPAWRLMNELPAFANAQRDSLDNAAWLQAHLVNIPSSVRLNR